MCGIAGVWDVERGRDLRAIAAAMTVTMAHRGPDDEDVWIDARAGVALGHRRLSIVDLSEAGRQPMVSGDGRYVLVTNGELYNHREVREALLGDGARFRGASDTEVMLEAIASWGLERSLPRFVGMFAFALWDAADRSLHLVRDRLGEKPLYYGRAGRAFVFASELKALRAHPDFDAGLDLHALDHYFRYSYVPAPGSVYRGVSTILAGTRVAVEAGSPSPPVPYWSLRAAAENGARTPFSGSEEEAIETLDGLLQDSVRLRMQADVPVGAFLSSGLDSSAVVSMMSRLSTGPVRTFTIGLADDRLNEAPAARAVANHLGTEHTERYVEAEEALETIPALAGIYDEPFADASAIPVLCVSRLARESCKAVLAGDGADELLGGYRRYAVGASIWNRTRWLPERLRRTAGLALGSAKNERLRGIGGVLGGNYPESIHWHLVSHWKGAGPIASDLFPSPREAGRTEADGAANGTLDFRTEMLYLDGVTLLPDDLLVKVDRATMAYGLEARLPFLDPAVVEFCFRLPRGMRTRGGTTKWALRQVLRRYLPDHLIAVEKKGFAVPLGAWLRGPLRDWAEDLISEESIRESEILLPAPIRALWRQHCAGTRDRSRPLWNVLMFQAWKRSLEGRPAGRG
jgi:asparagine synthase (glutamine-hydrolysing)